MRGRTTTYHFWARNALFHGLSVLGLNSSDKVLVPAFHCGTVVEPVIQFGAEVVFYNIHRNGTVDFDDLARKVDSQTKAIIAIHYFGAIQPISQLRSFCQQHSLFLIEDCAHILLGDIEGEPVGSFGDISIFSWRKFFPIYDGGLLVQNKISSQTNINWEKLDCWFQLKIAKNLLEKAVFDLVRPRRNLFSHQTSMSKKYECSINQEEKVDNTPIRPTQAVDFDFSQVNWPMSRWSKAILNRIDIFSIVQKRKANSLFLFDAINSIANIQPWVTIEAQTVCSWAFPVVASTRKDIHVKLREKGIEAFSWDGVIHPTLSLEEFPDAKFLYEHLILLPNQQSLTQQDMNLIIQSLKEILQCQPSREQAIL
ncbi:MAG: DegT/DnrJ/EryC1/StrS family aminotransferase [Nitrospirales bacterium]